MSDDQGFWVQLTPEEIEQAHRAAMADVAKVEEVRTTGRVILGRGWCSACHFPRECGQDFRCCPHCNHPVWVATPLEALGRVFLTDSHERWCTACGYSWWACAHVRTNSDPQGIPCCDVCDHPVWIATPMEEDE
jgi:hypothetical protein